jgi:hypothetical protein
MINIFTKEIYSQKKTNLSLENNLKEISFYTIIINSSHSILNEKSYLNPELIKFWKSSMEKKSLFCLFNMLKRKKRSLENFIFIKENLN